MTKFEMGDGTIVKTTFIGLYTENVELELCLDQLWNCLIKEGNQKIVGVELILKSEFGTDNVRLVLCTDVTCVIIGSMFLSRQILKNFLALKDVTFVGIHITEDLAMLEKDYGIKFRNVVDLSEYAANVFKDARLKSCSLSELACEVNNLKVKVKPASVAYHPNNEIMEYAAIDAYALFKIGKKLLRKV